MDGNAHAGGANLVWEPGHHFDRGMHAKGIAYVPGDAAAAKQRRGLNGAGGDKEGAGCDVKGSGVAAPGVDCPFPAALLQPRDTGRKRGMKVSVMDWRRPPPTWVESRRYQRGTSRECHPRRKAPS
jgi:hypothetical protein